MAVSLTFRWSPESKMKLAQLYHRVSKAQAFAQNREHFLVQPMKEEQVKAWAHNFPDGGRYGAHRGLSERAIEGRIRRGFPTGPPLLRSGRTRTFFIGDANLGRVSNSGVNWTFRNYIMKSDDSAMIVLQNKHRKFVGLENEDREMHLRRAEQWLRQLGRIVVSG